MNWAIDKSNAVPLQDVYAKDISRVQESERETLRQIDAELAAAEQALCDATQRIGRALVLAGNADFSQITQLLDDALEHKLRAENVIDAARAVVQRDSELMDIENV